MSRAPRGVHFASSERMARVASGSVQAVITSPPYWHLKDYGHPRQLGHGESYERYLARLDRVWAECRRALAPSGTMWVVVDKLWHRGEVVPIPFHVAMRCRRLGLRLQDLVVWNKPTSIAGMTERNLVNKHETVVFLSKGRDFKLRAARAEPARPPDVDRRTGRLTDVWRIPVKAGNLRRTPDHQAPYPEEIIRRLVEVSTDPGDLVLDPFLGSGTTMRVARALGRRCVGYEVNPAFAPLIEARLQGLGQA
jgi:site-specific DNA-methyltransferase (adenine-specific)